MQNSSPDSGHHRDRPIQAPGQMRVDFDERVNYGRLHDYRLARVREALARPDLGALLQSLLSPASGHIWPNIVRRR
jgi:hypothetical protein